MVVRFFGAVWIILRPRETGTSQKSQGFSLEQFLMEQ